MTDRNVKAGEYPSNLVDATPEVHVSGYLGTTEKSVEVEHGPRNGLYHLIFGEGQNVFVGNGSYLSNTHNLNEGLTGVRTWGNVSAKRKRISTCRS